MSTETGRDEIYVQPFSAGGSKASGKWMVSRGTRGMARWREDSKELMFVSGEGEIVAVDVAAGAAFQASRPEETVSDAARPAEQSESSERSPTRTRDAQRLLYGDAGARRAHSASSRSC